MKAEGAFAAKREWLRHYLRTTLAEAAPITADNVAVVEHVLMEAEVDAAREALDEAGPPRWRPTPTRFAQQAGTTCMSTSLANGLVSLGEPALEAEATRDERVRRLVDDVVARTSSFGKPGEYRSVDDLFKYLEPGRLRELDLGAGVRLEHDYRVRLTCALLDVVEALWSGRGRLIVQRRAHAHLVFGLERQGGAWHVLVRDPMHAPGPAHGWLDLGELRRDYLWSPLKKLPRLMGPHAFPSLGADALLGHLERYDGMENLGVECPSALLFRAQDAPPLFSPPAPAGAEEGGAGA